MIIGTFVDRKAVEMAIRDEIFDRIFADGWLARGLQGTHFLVTRRNTTPEAVNGHTYQYMRDYVDYYFDVDLHTPQNSANPFLTYFPNDNVVDIQVEHDAELIAITAETLKALRPELSIKFVGNKSYHATYTPRPVSLDDEEFETVDIYTDDNADPETEDELDEIHLTQNISMRAAADRRAARWQQLNTYLSQPPVQGAAGAQAINPISGILREYAAVEYVAPGQELEVSNELDIQDTGDIDIGMDGAN